MRKVVYVSQAPAQPTANEMLDVVEAAKHVAGKLKIDPALLIFASLLGADGPATVIDRFGAILDAYDARKPKRRRK